MLRMMTTPRPRARRRACQRVCRRVSQQAQMRRAQVQRAQMRKAGRRRRPSAAVVAAAVGGAAGARRARQSPVSQPPASQRPAMHYPLHLPPGLARGLPRLPLGRKPSSRVTRPASTRRIWSSISRAFRNMRMPRPARVTTRHAPVDAVDVADGGGGGTARMAGRSRSPNLAPSSRSWRRSTPDRRPPIRSADTRSISSTCSSKPSRRRIGRSPWRLKHSLNLRLNRSLNLRLNRSLNRRLNHGLTGCLNHRLTGRLNRRLIGRRHHGLNRHRTE